MFKVFEKSAEIKKEVFLKLIQQGAGVMLVAVNSTGDRVGGGAICTISEKGVYLHEGLSKEVDIELEGTRAKVLN